MNRPSTLEDTLRRSTVTARAPDVDRLQERARRRRRRRRGLATAAGASLAGVVALVSALAIASDPEPGRVETVDRPTTSEPATTTTTVAQMVTAEVADDEASAEPQPSSAGDLDPAILVPAGIELRWFSSANHSLPIEGLLSLVTSAGELGPAAWVGFNPGLETLDYADGPRISQDVVSPGGRTTRIGSDNEAGDGDVGRSQLTAIYRVPGGSVAISSHDTDQETLLALVDAIDVVGGQPVATDLPPGWRVQTPRDSRPWPVVSYSFDLAPEERISVRVERRRGTLQDLSWIRHWPEIVEVTSDGWPTLLVQGDNGPLGWTAALILTDDWVYLLQAPPWAEDTPPLTVEEMGRVVESLVPLDREELADQVPWLQDRARLIERWLADVEVPAGVDLEWLADGPPMAVDQATPHYRILTCVVALDWVQTGDPAALDHLADSANWAVSQDLTAAWNDFLDRRREAGDDVTGYPTAADRLLHPSVLDQAGPATTPEERMATDLVQGCWETSRMTGQAWTDATTLPGGDDRATAGP